MRYFTPTYMLSEWDQHSHHPKHFRKFRTKFTDYYLEYHISQPRQRIQKLSARKNL